MNNFSDSNIAFMGAPSSLGAHRPPGTLSAPFRGKHYQLVQRRLKFRSDRNSDVRQGYVGLFKTEVIHPRGPRRSVDDAEYATLEWVDWFNHRRLLQPIGDIPPAELEQSYYRQLQESARAA